MKNNLKAQTVQRIINLLSDPKEDWHLDEYRAKHIKSGIYLWIGNGMFCVNTCGSAMPLNLMDKWRIWQAVGTCKMLAMCKQLQAYDHQTNSIPAN